MQKKEREILDKGLLLEIMRNGKFTTISLCRNNEPYIVTLSYGFDERDNCLYFHSAQKGLKLEYLKENQKVCGTILEDLGYVKNDCSHKYRSIVFWGDMIIVENLDEKKHAFDILLNHLEDNPSKVKKRFFKSEESYKNTCLLKLDINLITGKASES
ncbi:MAG TPA: pyridoxamine 5'-phosphate oxidase family protein [Candidatus Nanopelagicaceae bacterium]|nr:pyridoxamine 5'-phosphate oxidase family protein [Candidatus Nanopelagicaceae bacterium]